MTMKKRGKDKRSDERLQQQFRVGVTIKPATPAEGEESQTVFCSTEDVSAGGLKVTFRKPLAVGTVVYLFLVFVNAFRGFEFKGRIVWVRKGEGKKPAFTAGVAFMDIPEPARIALRDAIEERLEAIQSRLGKKAVAKKKPGKSKKLRAPKKATRAKKPAKRTTLARPKKPAQKKAVSKPKKPAKENAAKPKSRPRKR